MPYQIVLYHLNNEILQSDGNNASRNNKKRCIIKKRKKQEENTIRDTSVHPSSALTDKIFVSREHLLNTRQKILSMTASGPLNNFHNSSKPSFMKRKLPFLLLGQLSVT